MESKLLGSLGLCRKAGKLMAGFDAVKDGIAEKTVGLVLLASDCSERTVREMERLAKEGGSEVLFLPLSMDEIHFTLGKRCGVFGVSDIGFEKKFRQLLGNENNL